MTWANNVSITLKKKKRTRTIQKDLIMAKKKTTKKKHLCNFSNNAIEHPRDAR